MLDHFMLSAPIVRTSHRYVIYAPVLLGARVAACRVLLRYTSGSTGKPKGVMLKQSAIVASVAGLEHYFLGISSRATSEATQEVLVGYGRVGVTRGGTGVVLGGGGI